ncbi:UNVERIFIED_CONTAM: hypothetical protein FKN15_076323, partial [Acipenser sinensis]
EELCSESVERIVVNPNAAYDKFKDKRVSTKGLDFSDRISTSRRIGYESGEYEILAEGCGVKETPQQKYQRLLNEIQELTEEVEQIKVNPQIYGGQRKWGICSDQGFIQWPPIHFNGLCDVWQTRTTTKESSTEEKLTPVALAKHAALLKQQLVSSHLEKVLGPDAAINLTDPDGALAKRLLIQLEAAQSHKGKPTEGKGQAKSTEDTVIYELRSRPEQNKFSETAKIAELEKRLAELETAVGTGPERLNTIEVLQAKVNALDAATLDQVEARLQSVLGKMNEIAKHKAAIEDAETQNKVSQLYEVIQKWDSMATTLPQTVQRLVAVKELHEQAMQFGQLLTHLDTTQQMIKNSLKDNSTLLTQVQQTMNENLMSVKDNFGALDARMKKLSK